MGVIEAVFALGIFGLGLVFPMASLASAAMFFLFKTAFLGSSESSAATIVVMALACLGSGINVKLKSKGSSRTWRNHGDLPNVMWVALLVSLTIPTMFNIFPVPGSIEIAQVIGLVLPLHFVTRAIILNGETKEDVLKSCRSMTLAFWILGIVFSAAALAGGQKNTSGQLSFGESANIVLGYAGSLGVLGGVALVVNGQGLSILKKLTVLALTVPSVLVLFGSEKRGAIISTVLGIILIALTLFRSSSKRFSGPVFLIFLVGAVGAYGSTTNSFDRFGGFSKLDRSAQERLIVQEHSMNRFYSSPVLGTGLGTGEYYPHNIFIESAEKGGVLAILFVLVLYVSTLVRLNYISRTYSDVAIFLVPICCVGLTLPLFSGGITMHRHLPMATGAVSAVFQLCRLFRAQALAEE